MMLRAAATVAVLAAAAPAAAAPDAELLPAAGATVVVSVTAAADISSSLVTATLREADAIWRAAGFRFIWERGTRVTADGLRVIIGGGVSAPNRQMPLAWIGFDEAGAPAPLLYVSHANAMAFMENSRLTVGPIDTMTILQRETYLARAMGRALAHEIGHYLMTSRAHTAKGLMMAVHSAVDFFSNDRRGFTIAAAERRQMAARFSSLYLASRG